MNNPDVIEQSQDANAGCVQRVVSWRNLDTGEIIQEGDEWWDWKDNVWRPAESTFGRPAHGLGDFRRKTSEQQPPANADIRRSGSTPEPTNKNEI